jgi:ribA/ribD-fused uncharacterized protein
MPQGIIMPGVWNMFTNRSQSVGVSESFCTISFDIAKLGISLRSNEERQQLMEAVYSQVNEVVNEEDVQGVQIYPSKWPRKVQIGLNGEAIKNQLLVAGLDIFDQHVDLVDDQEGPVSKYKIYDAPMDMDNEDISVVIEEYGKVLSIEDELLRVAGRETTWVTGTKIVSVCGLSEPLPTHIVTSYRNTTVTLTTWTRHSRFPQRDDKQRKCFKCGSSQHMYRECKVSGKLCFECRSSDHLVGDCPQRRNKQTSERETDEVVAFMGDGSVLSNLNMKYPITINGVEYVCNEQFIQSEKAKMFNDSETENKIMKSRNPQQIKKFGYEVDGFLGYRWRRYREDIVRLAVKTKFTTHEEARKQLLATGSKKISEATKDKTWGTGIRIDEETALTPEEWIGENKMGEILEDNRKELCDVEQNIDALIEEACSGAEEGELIEMSTNEGKEDEKGTVVIVGDSNCKQLSVEENCPFNVECVVSGGKGISDVPGSLDRINTLQQDVRVCLLHVGTCDMDVNADTDVDTVYSEYIESTAHVSSCYPDVEILVSSVPLRASRTYRPNERINKEIQCFNTRLMLLCKQENNLTFVDNDNGLAVNNHASEDLYKPNDKTGVHLNRKGCDILSDNFKEALHEIHYKIKLRREYNVQPSSD